jgi:hypothetical protein
VNVTGQGLVQCGVATDTHMHVVREMSTELSLVKE